MALIKVCIDPGHGGGDRSNRGPTGYIEADGVLDISKELRTELLSTGAFDVKLTREVDATLTLSQRGKIAADWDADLFISQHTNAASATATGTEVFYSVDLPGDKALAAELSANVASTLGIANRGAKTKQSTSTPGEDYYGVIDAAQDGGVKHVFIIESAFHTNTKEEAMLKDPAKRKAIAVAQAKAICKFYGITYPPVAKPVEPQPTGELYRIRRTWEGGYSGDNQIGAYRDRKVAEQLADDNPGYSVFNEAGVKVYPVAAPTPAPGPDYETVLCRIIVNGSKAIALTGKTKCINYAKATYEGHIVIQSTTDNVVVAEFDNVLAPPPVVTPPPTPEPPVVTPEPIKRKEIVKHPIMGQAECSAEQLAQFLLKNNPSPKIDCTTYKLAELFLAEGASEGVRGDLAFAQACHETGFFKFGGDAKPEWNNYCGLGVTGAKYDPATTEERVYKEGIITMWGPKDANGKQPSVGIKFANPMLGVRAQIQHLKCYAIKSPLSLDCADPRYDLLVSIGKYGIAPYIEDLGGSWAVPGFLPSKYTSFDEAWNADDTYGQNIYKLLEKIRAEVVDKPKPVEPPKEEPPVIVEPPKTEPPVVVEQPKDERPVDEAQIGILTMLFKAIIDFFKSLFK